MLKFNSYKPSYVPQPIEQIGKTLESLDSNNQRISQGYEKLSTALLGLDVRPEDQDIIQDTHNRLSQDIDNLVNSGNYDIIAGGLSNLTKKHLLQNNKLKASINRSNEYNTFRQSILDRYHKGDLDEERYNYFYNQPYIPTSATEDRNGNINPNYQGFKMPTKAVDLDKFLRGIVQTVGVDGSQSAPEYEYYTKGELAQLYGGDTSVVSSDTKFDPNEKTNLVKLKTIKSYQGKTKDKLRQALTSALGTNEEANAYIKELAEIRGVDPETLINSYITPYLEASSSISSVNYDDSGMRLQQQIAMEEFRQRNRLQMAEEEARLKGAKEQGFENGTYIGEVFIGDIIPEGKKPFNLGRDLYNRGGVLSKSDIELDKNLVDDDTFYKNHAINAKANELYGKDYNLLSRKERSNVVNTLNDESSKITRNALIKQNGFTLGDKAKKSAKDIVFGSDITKIDSKNPSIAGTASYTGFYSIDDGTLINPKDISTFIEDNNLKGADLDIVAQLDPNNSVIALALNDYGYQDGYLATIGNKRVIIPNPKRSFNQGILEDVRKAELLISDVGEGKPRSFKVVPFGQNNKVAIQYRDINDGVFGVTTNDGNYNFTVEQIKNNNNIVGYVLKTPNDPEGTMIEAISKDSGEYLTAQRVIMLGIVDAFNNKDSK